MNEQENNSQGGDDLLSLFVSNFTPAGGGNREAGIPPVAEKAIGVQGTIPAATPTPPEPARPARKETLYDISRASWTRDWTFAGKIHQYHRDLLKSGKAPEEIKHSKLRSGSCQCSKCKVRRHEYNDAESCGVVGDNFVADTILSREALRDAVFNKAFSEKLCGKVMTLPDKSMRVIFSMKNAPAEAIAIFNVSPEEEAFYGQGLKLLLDYYLELLDFEHASLVFFVFSYLLGLGERVGIATMILKGKQ